MFCSDYCIINFHVLCRIKYLNLNLLYTVSSFFNVYNKHNNRTLQQCLYSKGEFKKNNVM